MNKDVTIWARSCIACQRTKIHRHTVTPLGTFTESHKLSHVHIDLVGPLPPSKGRQYILTIIDRATGWPEAIPLRNIEATTVANACFKHWVARFGVPIRLTSDQGRQFESDLFVRLTQLLGIKKIRTTAYHPQSNGKVERWHRCLKAALSAHADNQNWTTNLPSVLLGLRSAVRESTGRSTAELMYSQPLRLPGEYFTPATQTSDIGRSMANFRQNNFKTFVPKALEDCTHIFLRNEAKGKLQPSYLGPFPVISRDNKSIVTNIDGKETRISANRVKPAYLFKEDASCIPNTNHGEDAPKSTARPGLQRATQLTWADQIPSGQGPNAPTTSTGRPVSSRPAKPALSTTRARRETRHRHLHPDFHYPGSALAYSK